ncbi:Gfo/Idh/MocA family protein [Paraburkholderia sp. ZP32-5]|uniref:Gfo/Idh/MocA family protein n=1 Tax=Paraburkholderia sp. ZP32-5 TaxID=2883245 RepID=UPI001F2CB94B|nr:Gfo/Idh/MocA family oxidoreductase [Paraburkholderia sp. ZP32-5]
MTGQIRIGMAGFGSAGRSFVPAITAHPDFDLVAVAEPMESLHEEIGTVTGAAVYASVAQMLQHPQLDAVYIATPTALHEEHVLLTVKAKKHVLVEKPMAINLARAKVMVDAIEASGVTCVVGHSHGFDLPIRKMREIIESGVLGRVRMVNMWTYTDWMYRPRRPDELDTKQGGTVTYRQGSHQFDILRVLCGGMAKSVRANVFEFGDGNRGIGAHTVFIEFEDGITATAVYNGYGNFQTSDLCFNVTEGGFDQPTGPSLRAKEKAEEKKSPQSVEDIQRAKQERARNTDRSEAPYQPFFGITLVSCEHGDIRQSPEGLLIYQDGDVRQLTLPLGKGPRELVLDEWRDAIAAGSRPLHNARWGLANLEICDAAIRSSRAAQEIPLSYQVPIQK